MNRAPYDPALVRALVASIRKVSAERDVAIARLLDYLEALDTAANDVAPRPKLNTREKARLALQRAGVEI